MDKIFAHITYEAQHFTFLVNDPDDAIQRHFMLGEFYEQRELEALRLYMPIDAVVIDVGTNVGNHAIYFDRIMKCSHVICFEPNPDAIALLRENVRMNQAHAIDLTHLELGVGRGKGRAKIMVPQDHNLGSATLSKFDDDQEEGIVVDALDNILSDSPHIDFIKIDTEGMELEVLAGAAQLIARYRPTVLVEVEESHRRAFGEWCDLSNYRIDQTFQQYRGVYNYVCVAKF